MQLKFTFRHVLGLLTILFWGTGAMAQISIPNASFTDAQDFSTLANTGTSSTLPAGWSFSEAGANQNALYTAGNGSSNTGDTYSFGFAAPNTERAFGGVQAGSLIPTVGVCYTNNTTATITQLTVTYTGETWRVGAANRTDGIQFQYNQNTTSIGGAGTWTSFSALDYFNPGQSVGSGSMLHSATISSPILGLSIAPGATFCFRWNDFNATGSDDGIGIDDYSLTNIVAPSPCDAITPLTCGTAVISSLTGTGLWNTSFCGNSTVGSEAVYSFTPTMSGLHTLIINGVSGNPVDFGYKLASEGCSSSGWNCIGTSTGTDYFTFGPLTAGTQYYILLDAHTTASSAQNFEINCNIVPANDLCANAITIPAVTGNICGTTLGANPDIPNNGATCGTSADGFGAGVWYTFVGTGQDWSFFFPQQGMTWDPEVNVYSGSCGALTCVTGDDDSGGGLNAQFTVSNTVLGTTYYVHVHPADDFGNGTSDFCFTVTTATPTCPTFSGTPANVTIINSTCNSGTVSGGSITAPGGTPCPAGSTLQYNVNNTGWTTTLPGYNQTGPVQNIKTRCSCDSDPNMVSTESSIVTTTPGSCAPANDLCANATPISCGTTISSSTVNATGEPGSFAPCGVVQTTAGVWYTFTGDGTTVTLSTCSAANFDTKISVYTGGCAAPTCVAGNDDACPGSRSSVTFTTTNGTVYLILIHGFGGATGTFDLSMTCVAPCPTFSGAPANVSIVDSSCGSGCTLTGGSITAPTGTPCPAGSTLQYNVNNSGWTTTLPGYNQSGPAQSIRTRCACNNDANNVSAESNPLSTMPGTLANPVVPANGAAIVACPALATQPTPPAVTACDGSAITPTGPVVTNTPNPLTCEGTRTYTWTYSCGATSSTWSFVYTIERNPFTVPANGAATVACLAAITVPVPPAVNSNCGEPIAPAFVSIVDSPAPLTCEGTRTYNYSYTDCEGNTLPWSFVYTIERNPFTVPANGAATVNAPALATQPTPPTVASNCGELLTPSGPVVTNNPNSIVCTGTRTYAWTYTDCEGNTAVWSFVYTIIDNTPPMVSCSNQTVTFNGQEIITLNAGALATVTDNCGTPTITLNPTAITCQQVGQQVPVTVTASDGINTATCTSTITVAGLPCGWSQNPDGVNCVAGNSISFNAGTGVYTATSTGCFYGPPYTADETSFAQRTLCGNGSITALVTGISGSALGWAGVVMRESNAAGAKKAQLMTNLSNLSRREFRTTTNGASQPQQFPSQDRYWLRITRVGNQFTMFVSANGINWFPAGAQNIVMSNCIQMGLAATNYTANSTVTATFANVSFTGSSGTLALPGGGEAALAPHSSLLTPDFEVYPNPTGGELNVDLANYVGRMVRLEVYSLEGKLMQFSEIDEVETHIQTLDMSKFHTGMYLIRVKSAGLPDAVQKVVLQRK